MKEDVLQGLLAVLGGSEGDAEVLDDVCLADVLVEGAGTEVPEMAVFLVRLDGSRGGLLVSYFIA